MVDETSIDELQDLLCRQRQAFLTDGFPSAAVRKDRLHRLAAMLKKYDSAICAAAKSDFGTRSEVFSRFCEVVAVLGIIRQTAEKLDSWMQDEKRIAPSPFAEKGARARVVYQPKGVVGIIGPWNYPVHLVLAPAIDAFAAGNRVIIKPSEITPRVSRVLQQGISEFFEESEAVVVTGGPQLSAALSGLSLDHLVFTGSTSVGRLVMKAAADNLVPVTLELGGKSPVVISRNCNLESASRRLIAAKMVNSGQFCVSPDHVYVPAERMDDLIAFCKSAFSVLYPTVEANEEYTSVINDHHYQRLQKMLDDARLRKLRIAECNPAGESYDQAGNRKMLLKFVIDPPETSLIMSEEIFGPVMAFIPYDSFDEVLVKIRRGPEPLAAYYYGEDSVEKQRILLETVSGGVTINDSCVHVGAHDLPLGGIGASGMGRYHGFEGFREFSNQRSVLIQTPDDEAAGFFHPPYSPVMIEVMQKVVDRVE